jgi:M6 family metalloprotease-like protein
MSAIFGETLTLPQGDGPPVELITYGDEFYARYENREGYTVVYDAGLAKYCYALVLDGRFVSTGVPLHKQPPAGVPRHLRESPEVRNEKFSARHRLMRGEPRGAGPTIQTFGRENGLLEGRRVSAGEVRGLTVLVQFQDEQASITQTEVEAMLNGSDFSRNGNHCSVNRYYQMMSAGALDYTNMVVGPITLSRNRDYYISNLLVEEALDILVEEMGVDLAQFDSRREGFVDALSFMYAGRTVYSDWLWPHNFTVDLKYNGIRTNYYTIQSMGRRAVDLSIGTFCHESGHMLCRFPDLYDYGTRDGDFEKSAGLGRYCLMGAGNHLDRGRTPSAVCAYLRDLVGWTRQEIALNGAGLYQAQHGDYGAVLRFDTDRPNEYFLVENRSRLGLDSHLPASGLAVYHCDILGSNEWQKGSSGKHYQVGLLQADGNRDLEMNRNTGDDGDLYGASAGTILTHDSQPDTLKWDGSDSGLVISQVSAPGEVIGFTCGVPAVPQQPAGAVAVELSPDLLIPDDRPEGVTSELPQQSAGRIESAKLVLDVTHTYVGDLRIELESPSGTKIAVHDRVGGSGDDLVASYVSDGDGVLQPLVGERADGLWRLHLADLARRDSGRLNHWRLELGIKSGAQRINLSSEPGLAIPDHPAEGASDSLRVEASGRCRNISIAVEIEHTFVGDLKIDLTTPEGSHLTLRQGEGGSRKNLNAVFDDQSTPALAALQGEPVAGEWILAVTDQASMDTGVLRRWSLDILAE